VRSMKTSGVAWAAMLAAACALLFSSAASAQQPAPSTDAITPQLRDLQEQVRELHDLLNEMRAESAESRSEMRQLRQDLETTRALLQQTGTSSGSELAASSHPSQAVEPEISATTTTQPGRALEQRVQKLEESASLTRARVDEQYQTKVETASKYRARLHGIVLMNAFRNVGGANSVDFPDYAQAVDRGSPLSSIGASLRQSELGLEVFGPTIARARTSADIQMDFAGGFPATGNGVNFGIVRLQTASVRFEWQHTSIIAGQDSLFISPLSPTSFASLATPAFAFAGNLWGWTPQLRVEHRFSISDRQTLSVQAGLLDNLDWEVPADPFYRYAQAGEQSGQPAYALRTAWSRPVHEHVLSFGAAGYYGRQNWNWDRYVDAWAGMADWQIPLSSRFSVSGEFYRGRGIGGLGAGVGRSIVYSANSTSFFPPIRGLDTAGGWTQLKIQLTPKLEANGAIAEDDTFTGDIRGFATDATNFSQIFGRNRGALGNVVFRPRSDLLLSAELRRLHTFPVFSTSNATSQLNLAVGILF